MTGLRRTFVQVLTQGFELDAIYPFQAGVEFMVDSERKQHVTWIRKDLINEGFFAKDIDTIQQYVLSNYEGFSEFSERRAAHHTH